jgi:hypothetical protein
VQQAILGGAISGGIGLAFFALRMYLTYLSNRVLQRVLNGEDTLDPKVKDFQKRCIGPFMSKIFERIKTTGFLGYRSTQATLAYRDSIELCLVRLANLGVNIHLDELPAESQLLLKNEVAAAYDLFVGFHGSTCSPRDAFRRWYRADATPHKLYLEAQNIAEHVRRQLPQGDLSASKELRAEDLSVNDGVWWGNGSNSLVAASQHPHHHSVDISALMQQLARLSASVEQQQRQ